MRSLPVFASSSEFWSLEIWQDMQKRGILTGEDAR